MSDQRSHRYPLLTWWMESLDALDQLSRRRRARVLSQIARDVREALQEGPPTLEEQQRAWQAAAEHPRVWSLPQPSGRVRIIE